MKYTIEQDVFADDPRNWDNLGIMTLAHRRYDVVDEAGLNGKFDSADELYHHIEKELGGKCILPVYMMDHGSITLKTTPFEGLYGRFDSGLLGFIFTTEEKIKEIGTPEDHIEEVLNAEVQQYGYYLDGDVWLISILDEDEEVVDFTSFYGRYSDAEKDAQENLKHYDKP